MILVISSRTMEKKSSLNRLFQGKDEENKEMEKEET